MDFIVNELLDNSREYFEITNDKNCLLNAKTLNKKVDLKIGFDTLNLGTKLYGSNKKESVKIQRQNCKLVLKFYRQLRKIIKLLIKNDMLSGEIFIENLSKKLNNNDFMILGMLNVDFNKKGRYEKLKAAYEIASDFLDKENSLNNMCDFHDNQCVKFREKNQIRITGCCPTYCKLLVPGQACVHKNLSCKIFMCDNIIKKGYYFTPYTLAILRKNMTPLEILVASGSFFRTPEQALKRFWIVKLFRAISIVAILLLILSFIK